MEAPSQSPFAIAAEFLLSSSVIAYSIRLIATKGLLEPAAVWAFITGYKATDEILGDKLPDLPEALGGDPDDTPEP